MSRPKKNRSARDTNFIMCLLVHGPKPKGPSQELSHYKDDVRAWWLDMNKHMDPPIKVSRAYKFWNRYNQWYENMMTNERRTDRVAHHIVENWTKDAKP